MPGHAAFVELIRALAHENARTLVVGTLARKLHGESIEASDLVLWYDCDGENAQRVYRALARVGAPLDGVSANDLCMADYAFVYGDAGNEIELVGGIDGMTFEDAWYGRLETHAGTVILRVIGAQALRAVKLAERVR